MRRVLEPTCAPHLSNDVLLPTSLHIVEPRLCQDDQNLTRICLRGAVAAGSGRVYDPKHQASARRRRVVPKWKKAGYFRNRRAVSEETVLTPKFAARLGVPGSRHSSGKTAAVVPEVVHQDVTTADDGLIHAVGLDIDGSPLQQVGIGYDLDEVRSDRMGEQVASDVGAEYSDSACRLRHGSILGCPQDVGEVFHRSCKSLAHYITHHNELPSSRMEHFTAS